MLLITKCSAHRQNPTNTVLRSSESKGSATRAAQLSGDKEPQDRIQGTFTMGVNKSQQVWSQKTLRKCE